MSDKQAVISRTIPRLAAGLAAGAMAGGAWAGSPLAGTITYGPLSTVANVPTLGEWSLALMALLVAVVAYRALRGRVGGRLLSHLLLIGAAATAVGTGHDLMSVARAVATTVEFSQAGGGSLDLHASGSGTWEVVNISGVPQQVKSRTTAGGFEFYPPEQSPECTVGLTVGLGAKCYVAIRYLPG